jgi:peptide-methionine (S)-S-oxide reductase
MAILAYREIEWRRTMWRILRKKTEMPTADRALPGRAAPSFNVPAKHFVSGNRI